LYIIFCIKRISLVYIVLCYLMSITLWVIENNKIIIYFNWIAIFKTLQIYLNYNTDENMEWGFTFFKKKRFDKFKYSSGTLFTMLIWSSLVTCNSVYSDCTNYVPLPLEVFWDDSVLLNMQICEIQFPLGWLPWNNNQSFNSITFNTMNVKLISMPVSMVIYYYYDNIALQKVRNIIMVILYCNTHISYPILDRRANMCEKCFNRFHGIYLSSFNILKLLFPEYSVMVIVDIIINQFNINK